MSPVWTAGRAAAGWARADLRARWRSLVALGVLVGVCLGLAAAAVAGARRTDTSFDRLRSRTSAADAIVFPGQVGIYQADWDALRRRPEVAALARWTLTFGRVPGHEEEAVLFAATDSVWLNEVDRPVVVEGRMFDPAAPDEVVVGEAATAGSGPGRPYGSLHVGSVIDYTPYALDEDDTSGDPPQGPHVQLRVVGVVRHVPEFLFVPGMIMLSPGFLATHGTGLLLVENAMVRLAGGAADASQFRADVNELVAPGVPINDLHVIERRVDTTIRVERVALLLLGAAVALAGIVLMAQALGRSVSIPENEVFVLRAMGFDRFSIALCTALVHTVVAIVGSAVALAVAVAASRWFPVGLASRVDPDRGIHADWLVLGPTMVLAVAVVLGYATVVGWRLSDPRRRSTSPPRQSSLAYRLSRMAPLTVGVATAMAFGTRRLSRDLVRPALVGAVVGVLGVVGTLTIDRGLNDALAHPARAGVAWDATVTPVTDDRTTAGVSQTRIDSIRAVPAVADAVSVSRLVSEVNGAGVPLFSVEPAGGSIALVSTSGRPPDRDDEAAIGPETARQLHIGIGDSVSVGSLDHRVRIVGEALFPADVHAGFDEGLWLTSGGLESTEPPVAPDDVNGAERVVAIRFQSGTDVNAAIADVARAQGESIAAIEPVEVPPELTNLRNVRTLPRLVAGFLALLAAAAVAHVLAAAVNSRRRDFATLRALGMTRGGTRAILNMQAAAIAIVGLVVGIPLGLAVGRIGWRLVTVRVPLRFVGPVPLAALLVLVPAAVGIANVLALWPGRRLSRLRPAEVLRTE